MQVRYYPRADMMQVAFGEKASTGSQEVSLGLWSSGYDEEGSVVGIEMEDAILARSLPLTVGQFVQAVSAGPFRISMHVLSVSWVVDHMNVYALPVKEDVVPVLL